jgi:dinuclear metal center YbgI/SA1388 family protein
MATVGEVIAALETFAPPAYQENYDNAGLITGDKSWQVTGVLCCLDSTEAVLDEAIRKGCNMVIAHHPIIFSGLKRITGKHYVERVIIQAIKHDIAIYAAHTNLDNVRMGVNERIAQKLQLSKCRVLDTRRQVIKQLHFYVPVESAEKVKQALFDAGAGQIGEYAECSFSQEGVGTFKPSEIANPVVGKKGERHHEPEMRVELTFPHFLEAKVLAALNQAHPYEEVAYGVVTLDNHHQLVGSGLLGELEEPVDEKDFLHFLKEKMQTDCIRYTALVGKKVKKVAVCGGAGSFLLPHAISAGADVFITGDFKYHQFFDADSKVVIADIGHYESEQFTAELFYDILREKFPNFALHLTKTVTNPIKYL